MLRLAALITVYNRADFVGRCIESVAAVASDACEVRFWVMDNGSVDGSAEVAQAAAPAVTVLRTEDNRRLVTVLNRGLRAVCAEWPDCDAILLLNDDTAFVPGGLELLLEAAQEHPNAFMTPLQLSYREPGSIDPNALGLVQQTRALVEDAVMGRPVAKVYDTPTIIGAAIYARREAWQWVGEFDELFFFYGIDDDICTRARWLGYEVLLVPGARLLHAHGKLGARNEPATRASILAKWRKETQARFLFLLKSPDEILARNVLRLSGELFCTACGCMWSYWPAGAWHALRIYGWCLLHLPQIAAARRRHFDPAKKISH